MVSGRWAVGSESTTVIVSEISDQEIADYVATGEPMDKAGAYSIQEQTDLIIASYRGSFSNIMGLPMEATKQILTQAGLLGACRTYQ